MESNDAKALPDPREAVAGEDRALFPRPYFALYHFQGGGGGGGKSDGSKTNFTLMEKLFNIPRLREGDEGRGEREGGRGQAVPPLEEWRQEIRVASFTGGLECCSSK